MGRTGEKPVRFRKSMARILLTGFVSFGEHIENVSELIVNQIPSNFSISDPWDTVRQESTVESIPVEIEKQILSVDEDGSKSIASRLINGHRWDAIIHLGLSAKSTQIKLETKARNLLDMAIPDNSGREVRQNFLGERDIDCSNKYVNHLLYPEISDFEFSNDAGSYVCNETYYRTLSTLNDLQLNEEIPCFFLHIPIKELVTVDFAIDKISEVISRLFFKPVIDVVGALFLQDKKMLLARKNSKDSLCGKWEFPGGKIEPNEDGENAIVREIMEEFGWAIRVKNKFGSWFYEYELISIVLHIFAVDFVSEVPNLMIKDDWTSHDLADWFDNSKGLNLLGADAEVAREVERFVKSM